MSCQYSVSSVSNRPFPTEIHTTPTVSHVNASVPISTSASLNTNTAISSSHLQKGHSLKPNLSPTVSATPPTTLSTASSTVSSSNQTSLSTPTNIASSIASNIVNPSNTSNSSQLNSNITPFHQSNTYIAPSIPTNSDHTYKPSSVGKASITTPSVSNTHSQETQVCSYCGSEINKSEEFCPFCGHFRNKMHI
jgi:hypothetical protein